MHSLYVCVPCSDSEQYENTLRPIAKANSARTHILIMEQWKCIVFEMQRDNVFVRRHFTNYVTQRECQSKVNSMCLCVSSYFIEFEVRGAHIIYLFIFILDFLLMQAADSNGILQFDCRQLKAYFTFLSGAHWMRNRFFFACTFRHRITQSISIVWFFALRRLTFASFARLVKHKTLQNIWTILWPPV